MRNFGDGAAAFARSRAAGGVGVAFCLALACGERAGNAPATDGPAGRGASSASGSSAGGITANAGASGATNGGGTNGGGTSGGAVSQGGRATSGGGGALESGGVSTNGAKPATDGGRTASAGDTSTRGGEGGNPAAGAAGATGAVTCPRYDASNPPTTLALTGNLGTHDPALIAAGDEYYLFQTGPGLPTKTSKDLLAWQGGAAVFSTNPAWIATAVPAASDLWAPDISNFGGSYHLYYAASSFGKNTSCIGHATRTSLSAGAWSDHGSVICSGSGDDFNAIDPNLVVDDAGTPWLAFGSFWNGIQIQELDATGTPTSAKPEFIASRPSAGGALEGAFIVRACGYYYLFTSWDHCCDSPWNYSIHVGRATNVTGPYTDKAGKALLDGGGTLLVSGNDTWTAPGHNAVIFTANGAYDVYHALDANHANPTLRIAELAWDDDGWPVSGGP